MAAIFIDYNMLTISPGIAERFMFHNHKYAMTLPLCFKIVAAQVKLEYDPVAPDGYWTKQRRINPWAPYTSMDNRESDKDK